MVTLVLDTNIVLDWLVFNDASTSTLQNGVRDGPIVLYTHAPALEELQRVLSYPALQLNASQQAEIFASYQARTRIATLPEDFSLQNLALPPTFPRCRDPDDQHFLALALHSHADALVSRDQAVLALRKRAEKFAVRIIELSELAGVLPALHTH